MLYKGGDVYDHFWQVEHVMYWKILYTFIWLILMSVSLQQLTESDVTDAALSSSDADQMYHQISEGSNVSELW